MAENNSIWVKYLDLNPVEIDTHYFNNQERKRPLTYVADLIDAFQQRRGSLLANTDEGLITISINSTSEALDPGDLLAGLGENGSTCRNPLIIKSRNGEISMGENITLQGPVYDTPIRLAGQGLVY